jgi:hypothetical protein
MEIQTCRSFTPSLSRLLTVSALSLLIGQTDALAYTVKTAFPRLGGTKNGTPHAYDNPSAQAQLARLDYILIDFSLSWGSVTEMRDAVKAIKIEALAGQAQCRALVAVRKRRQRDQGLS